MAVVETGASWGAHDALHDRAKRKLCARSKLPEDTGLHASHTVHTTAPATPSLTIQHHTDPMAAVQWKLFPDQEAGMRDSQWRTLPEKIHSRKPTRATIGSLRRRFFSICRYAFTFSPPG